MEAEKRVQKSKVAGWLIFLVSILTLIIDLLDGGPVNLYAHALEIGGALNGLGIVFIRMAIERIEKLVREFLIDAGKV